MSKGRRNVGLWGQKVVNINLQSKLEDIKEYYSLVLPITGFMDVESYRNFWINRNE